MLKEFIASLNDASISQARKEELSELIGYVQSKKDANKEVNLNFICTHNSRRSQLAQVWAQLAADTYGISANCFSGGVEVTAFYKSAIKALKNAGLQITKEDGDNPLVNVKVAEGKELTCFSKVYDDKVNPTTEFSAVMTCDHADQNCPFIPGTEKRISLPYKDPKEFDGTPVQQDKYDERSKQIATEMFYVFKNVK